MFNLTLHVGTTNFDNENHHPTTSITATIDSIQTVFAIENFDSSKTTITRWFQSLQRAFEVFSIPSTMQVPHLLHCVGQEAYNMI